MPSQAMAMLYSAWLLFLLASSDIFFHSALLSALLIVPGAPSPVWTLLNAT